MVRFRPLSGVVGPLPNGRTLWLINGGPDPNYWIKSWDDPPSKGNFLGWKTLRSLFNLEVVLVGCEDDPVGTGSSCRWGLVK